MGERLGNPAMQAMAGDGCLTVSVLLAMISFYRKRSRGDRPQI
jgi:hypothetical protein